MSVVINDVLPKNQFTATSLQTVFDCNFSADVASDITVYARASGAAADDVADLISSANYNVTFIGGSLTVRVTFLVGRTLNDVVTIVRATPDDRDNLYSNTNFVPSMLNGDFGRNTFISQQNKLYTQEVSTRYNVSATIDKGRDVILPILSPDETWVMNSAGTAIQTGAFPSAGAAPADATYLTTTANSELANELALSTLSDGLMVNNTGSTTVTPRTLTGTADEIDVSNGSGVAGNPTVGLANNPTLPGNTGFQIPAGTTAQRVVPSSPNINMRYNTDNTAVEYYDHGLPGWVDVDTNSIGATLNSIQWNNAGAFDGTANFTTDGSTVSIIGDLDVDNININGNEIISTDAAGDIIITPDTTGDLILDGLKWPQSDGTSGQVVGTDAAGQLVWEDTITPLNLQKNTYVYDVDTGVADAYVVTLSPVPTAYVDGLYCIMKALNTNTGPSTININGLGVLPLQVQGGAALKSQQIVAGEIYWIIINNSGASAKLINPNVLAIAAEPFYIGSSLAGASAVVTSDGATITLTYQLNPTGDMTLFFSSGVYTLDCTPALTIALTAGTDIAPQLNYIYILESTKALTLSTTSWPSAEHVPVARVLCQSAASIVTQGVYSMHAWSDNVAGGSDDNGHFGDINYWIRNQNATWVSGTLSTTTTGVATFDLAVASGVVLQLHDHTFPAFDTAASSFVLVPNDPTTAYVSVSDLATILTDANGVSMSNKRYNLVVWGNISEDTGDCQLFVNLPTASYNSDGSCIDDVDNTAIYTIPSSFKGTGFLISRLSIRHISSSNTFSELQNEDLRGLIPATAAGGGIGGISALIDDPNPTLANDLDMSTFGLKDANGNALIEFGTTASAVNELTIANAATANAVTLSTTGDDANVDLDIDLKGTGALKINGSAAKIDTILDDDTMAADDANALATQQSIKGYVDSNINRKNLIIGGDFSTNPWQRGTSFAPTATGDYTADRFKWVQSGAGVISILKTASAPTVAQADYFTNSCLEIDVTTADASIAAGDVYWIQQFIEGYNMAPTSQSPMTLSFWVYSTVTGIFTVTLSNNSTIGYVSEYTVNASNTWEKKTITIAAPPAGFLLNSTNGVGGRLLWVVAAGSNYNGVAQDWTNNSALTSTSNQVNGMSSTSNTFRLALIQLEKGSTATPFEIRTRSEELALCQRYYQKTFQQGVTPAQASGSGIGTIVIRAKTNAASPTSRFVNFPVVMRATPSATFYNPVSANALWYSRSRAADSGAASTMWLLGQNGMGVENAGVAADVINQVIDIHYTVDAEL